MVYHWELMWTLARLGPALILILLLLRPANRSWHAWLILPLTLVYATGLAMTESQMAMDPSGFLINALVVLALSLGIAWALLDLIAVGGRKGAFFMAACVLGLAIVFCALCVACLEAEQALQFAVVACVGGAAYLLAMLMGGVGCRKGYRPRRFVRWYGLTLLFTPLILGLPLFLISFIAVIAMVGFGEVLGAIGWVAGMSLGAGAAMLVLTLPYLWIGLASPGHRERLGAIYRVPGLGGDLVVGGVEAPSPHPSPGGRGNEEGRGGQPESDMTTQEGDER